MTPRTKWVIAIVALLGGNAAAMTVLIAGSRAQPPRIDPAYTAPRPAHVQPVTPAAGSKP